MCCVEPFRLVKFPTVTLPIATIITMRHLILLVATVVLFGTTAISAQTVKFAKTFDAQGNLVTPDSIFKLTPPQLMVALKFHSRTPIASQELFVIVKDADGTHGRFIIKRSSRNTYDANGLVRVTKEGIFRAYIYDPTNRTRPLAVARLFVTSQQHPTREALVLAQRNSLIGRGLIQGTPATAAQISAASQPVATRPAATTTITRPATATSIPAATAPTATTRPATATTTPAATANTATTRPATATSTLATTPSATTTTATTRPATATSTPATTPAATATTATTRPATATSTPATIPAATATTATTRPATATSIPATTPAATANTATTRPATATNTPAATANTATTRPATATSTPATIPAATATTATTRPATATSQQRTAQEIADFNSDMDALDDFDSDDTTPVTESDLDMGNLDDHLFDMEEELHDEHTTTANQELDRDFESFDDLDEGMDFDISDF
jgi:hypothetical protein